jgi:hypothetical protein
MLPITMRLLVTAALLFALIGCSKKEEAPEPPPVREVTQSSNPEQAKAAVSDFLKATDFNIAKAVSAIPKQCLHAFNAADFDANGDLVDPPADGDHAKWDKKSKKRLIFAGSNPRTCFVYFRGGTSLPIYNLQIFHAGPPTTLAYHGSDTENIYPDLAALRRGYQKHAFLDVSAPPPSK